MPRFPSSSVPTLLHVSVHDVTPESLDRVRRILDFLRKHRFFDVTLLVVPGHRWDDAGISVLMELSNTGYTLAGHGWRHRADEINGIGHLFHSLLISRNVAEHLAHDTAGICRLIKRCHNWFVDHDLGSPKLYVPPAWAMGRVTHKQLDELPFSQFEYLSGFYDTRAKVFERVPLVGFEADSWARFMSLYPLNKLNMLLSRGTNSLRVALHPNDLDLLMGSALRSMFDSRALCHLHTAPSE